ncbi:cytochrome c [Methylococcus sp. EFPC2]|uniref:c-type cytochrome n=1 Tax=Methylococcus sp. EFPC2 TaxID=2812648 RepID=UPI001966F542|nr:cytochrome c [Methylococcus sp. EFPC2]QSA97942.1 cytochrome c [Methylococcus sp. EFPC2]
MKLIKSIIAAPLLIVASGICLQARAEPAHQHDAHTEAETAHHHDTPAEAAPAHHTHTETVAEHHHDAQTEAAPHHHHASGHHWSAPKAAQKRRNPVAADEVSIKQGETLFQTHCSSCHGVGGEGNGPAAAGLETPPTDLKAMASHHSDGDLAWKIGEGRGLMPGWKAQLQAPEIWSLVNYIKQLPRR